MDKNPLFYNIYLTPCFTVLILLNKFPSKFNIRFHKFYPYSEELESPPPVEVPPELLLPPLFPPLAGFAEES